MQNFDKVLIIPMMIYGYYIQLRVWNLTMLKFFLLFPVLVNYDLARFS